MERQIYQHDPRKDEKFDEFTRQSNRKGERSQRQNFFREQYTAEHEYCPYCHAMVCSSKEYRKHKDALLVCPKCCAKF